MAKEVRKKRRIVVEESDDGSWVATLVRCEVFTARNLRNVTRAIELKNREMCLQRKIDRKKKELENDV